MISRVLNVSANVPAYILKKIIISYTSTNQLICMVSVKIWFCENKANSRAEKIVFPSFLIVGNLVFNDTGKNLYKVSRSLFKIKNHLLTGTESVTWKAAGHDILIVSELDFQILIY